MAQFSIIIPVYNAQATLPRCLDSLKCQSFGDFEALLVENGSQDASRALCAQAAASDPRFRLIPVAENCGSSGARNAGLAQAQGEWIAFVDSDDYVEPDYLESLAEALSQADVAFLGYHQETPSGHHLGDFLPQVPEGSGYYETLAALLDQDLFGYTWIKAFRREKIGVHRFPGELQLMEDLVFTCRVLATPCSIRLIPRGLYHYVTGSQTSLMGRTHPDYCRILDVAYGEIAALLAPWPGEADFIRRLAQSYGEKCRYYGFERDVDPDAFFSQLKRTAFFRDAAMTGSFSRAVAGEKHLYLRILRRIYRTKVSLSRLKG